MDAFTAKSPVASHLRRRKYELVRHFGLPEGLVGGCLCQTHRRCGKPNCHCAVGPGHPLWSITFSRNGHRRVERVPSAFLSEIQRAVVHTHAFLDAIKELMTINLDLLAHTRRNHLQKKVRRRQKNVRFDATNDQLFPAPIDPLPM